MIVSVSWTIIVSSSSSAGPGTAVIYGEAIALRPEPLEPLQQLLTAIRAGTATVLGSDAYRHVDVDADAEPYSHALALVNAGPVHTQVAGVTLIRPGACPGTTLALPLDHRSNRATAPRIIWRLTMVGPLPGNLPAPGDDGAADHLPGRLVPPTELTSTDGATVHLDQLGPDRTVLYCYPLTGRADVDLPDGWDSIPGARGCTNEACDFRNNHTDLLAAGAAAVYGVSTQSTAYQAELVGRLRLPFAMLSDSDLALAAHLDLPTFAAGGMTLYRRHTLVVRGGVIEHVFYPVFPPDQHASEVLAWLASHRRE